MQHDLRKRSELAFAAGLTLKKGTVADRNKPWAEREYLKMRDEPDLPSRQRRKSSTAAAGLHRRRHRDPPIPGQTILSARFPPESGRPIRRTLRLQRSRREICRACRRVSAGRQIDGKHYRLWAVGNRPSFEHRRFC